MNLDKAVEYEEQLNRMLASRDLWFAQNPFKEVTIQWNFPREVAVIAPISDAIKNHFVTVNDAALDLIKSLHPWDCSNEPTVLMVRAVLEWEGA